MLTIRPAGPGDWTTWRDLRLRALADAPDAFGETLADAERRRERDWQEQVRDRLDTHRLLAERDGTPVGMMVVVIDAVQAGRAHVYAMWVAPEARRTGVARRLVEAGLAWARAHAALDVQLRVSERVPGARALYERCGFAPSGTREPLRPGASILSDTLAVRLPPLVMGVVNVTPDSFSDGGEFLDPRKAIAHGLQLATDGADILDVGGEATNPRATATDAHEELRRVVPVIEGLVAAGHAVSIDTTKAQVARTAAEAGARFINDVAGGLFDPSIRTVAAELAPRGVTYIAGHLRGTNLREVFSAEGTVSWQTVASELVDRIAGLPAATVWVDPGLGFGKGSDPAGNVSLLRHGGDIAATVGRPIVVGASRKRFVRRTAGLTDAASREALDAASTLATLAAVRAGAHVVRVHNVALLQAQMTAYNKK